MPLIATPEGMPTSAHLPPTVLLALTIVLGVAVIVIGGGIVLVALRPTTIEADNGSKVDYSPRTKVEVSRPQAEDEPQ